MATRQWTASVARTRNRPQQRASMAIPRRSRRRLLTGSGLYVYSCVHTQRRKKVTMWPCRTRPSMSPMETSPCTSAPRSSQEATFPRRSPRPFVGSSTRPKAFPRAMRRSPSGSASVVAERSASPAVLVGEFYDTIEKRFEHYQRLPRPDEQVRPPRRADGSGLDGRRGGQAGRLARLPGHRQRPLRRHPGRVDARGPRHPSTSSGTRSPRSSSTWSRDLLAIQPSRISTSSVSPATARGGGA